MVVSQLQRMRSWNVEVFMHNLPAWGFLHRDNSLCVSQIAYDFNICYSTNKPDNDAISWQPAFLRETTPANVLIVLDERDNNVFPIPDTGSIDSYKFILHSSDKCVHAGEPHTLNDPCVYQQLGMTQRRFDPRYYSIGAKSIDNRLAGFPTRSSSQTRGFLQTRTSSLKRGSTNSSPTGSPSPSRTDTTGAESPSIIAGIDARRAMNTFPSNIFQGCLQGCVITGKGLVFGTQGPSLEAAYIVPQSQWNTFPINSNNTMADPNNIDELQLAWKSTWNGSINGVMMLSHIHKCLDTRLFAIHPETHLIRVFVDYDIINEFHNKRANLPRITSKPALQLLWDLAVLENTPSTSFPFPQQLTDIPEFPKPKAMKLNHGDPSKASSSTQASHTQATDTEARDTQASDTQALPTSIYHFRAHPPSPPLSERASEGHTLWPFGKETLVDSDTVQQLARDDEVLEDEVLEGGVLEEIDTVQQLARDDEVLEDEVLEGGVLEEIDTVQQLARDDEVLEDEVLEGGVLEEINAKYGRGRSEETKQCTAARRMAEEDSNEQSRDSARGAKRQKLEMSPFSPVSRS
ncbi:hypothetical protein VM1G_03636 [Cytospora mali]|uniref:HNH nuclease domain-containing protein n=1 Tax=Cytospora mali TaxID=578113 RepID=A0A194VX32_CYTMA|nr:hypothetical protein VM1G_03636 [Valsa mali]